MENVRGTRGLEDGNKPVIEKIVPSAGWIGDSNCHHLLVDLPGFNKHQVQIQVVSTGHIKASGERVTNQNKTVRFEQIYKIPSAENSDLNKVTAKFDGEILYVTISKKPQEGEEKRDDGEKQKEEQEATSSSLEKKKDDVVNGHEENNTTQQQKRLDYNDEVAKNKEENTQQKPAKEEEEEAKSKELGDDQNSSSKKKEEKNLKGNEIVGFSEEDVKKWEDDGDCLRNTIKNLSQNRGIILTAVIAFSLGLLLSRRFQVGH